MKVGGMTLEIEKRYRQATDGLHQRAIAGIAVVHRADWDEPLVMNTALQLVWTCLEFGGSVDEIADDISEVFGDMSDGLPEKVVTAFRTLAEFDLIEPVEPG